MTTVTWLSTSVLPRRPPKSFFRGRQIGATPVVKAAKWPRASEELALLRGDKPLAFSRLQRRRRISLLTAESGGDGSISNDGDDKVQRRRWLQAILWIAEGIYVIWLFLLPYAPGDPIWAISSDTVNHLLGLSLNFFFILPLFNNAGIHFLEAPLQHPVSEGLFNFVIGWTFLFAPLLFTDHKRDRYKGSLDVLWSLQMFLTNTFLIPYMAIRLNGRTTNEPRKASRLGSIITNNAPIVGIIGAGVCLLSTIWAFLGRGGGGGGASSDGGDFGGISERWDFLVSYIGSERLAYAFVWDICLYMIFQPWLVGDNLQNIRKDKVKLVSYLRFVPFVGLLAYCLCLNIDHDKTYT